MNIKHPVLLRYLSESYRRNVMKQDILITPFTSSSDILEEIDAELARIEALKLGANLAQRSFVDYQNRKALQQLKYELQVTGSMRATDKPDQAHFTGH